MTKQIKSINIIVYINMYPNIDKASDFDDTE